MNDSVSSVPVLEPEIDSPSISIEKPPNISHSVSASTRTALASLGIPQNQIALLEQHLDTAGQFVHAVDAGFSESFEWLKTSLFQTIGNSDQVAALLSIVRNNFRGQPVTYGENGYDSYQSRRCFSKVVSEALLVGGVLLESSLLGLKLNLSEVQQMIGSSLAIEEAHQAILMQLAQTYGGRQDFLFPGVIPSSPDTPGLDGLAYQALKGTPLKTVRSLTGIGGFRADNDRSYAVDLSSFAHMKVQEDRRYYPGVGIFYLLQNMPFEQIPLSIKKDERYEKVQERLKRFVTALKAAPTEKFSGVSVLCSAYIPPWHELKTFQGFMTKQSLPLAESFHSASYEFMVLKKICQAIGSEKEVTPALLNELDGLEKKLGYCWSFNSTVHLSWTNDLSYLAHDLFGKMTNQLGDTCSRFGLSYKGKSLEVREYVFGVDRNFPAGVAGGKAYAVRFYAKSEQFEGKYETSVLLPHDPFWQKIEKQGFLKATLSLLASK